MKLLLLTLVLGLAYAKQNSKVAGEWRTQYIASTNAAMTDEGGPIRAYVRDITCGSDCETVNVTFYVKTPECQLVTVVGTLTEDDIYATDFSGQNYFQFVHVTKDFMVIYIKNVNGDSVTEIMEAFAPKGETLTDQQVESYYKMTEKRGIPRENAQFIPPNDICPQ